MMKSYTNLCKLATVTITTLLILPVSFFYGFFVTFKSCGVDQISTLCIHVISISRQMVRNIFNLGKSLAYNLISTKTNSSQKICQEILDNVDELG